MVTGQHPLIDQRFFPFLFYLLTAVCITQPLVFYLTSRLPLGTEPAATVPFFNLWTLMWNATQWHDLFSHYWNAPIFYPEVGAFALSEPQPLTGLLFAPIASATHSPVFAYNLLFLLHITLNGVGAYSLCRIVLQSPSRSAPLMAGLFAQTLPFVTNEWGVLQLTAVYPVWFTLLALHQWAMRPTALRAMVVGVWGAAVFLTSTYYGLFLLPFVLLYIVGFSIWLVVGKGRTWQTIKVVQRYTATGVIAIGIAGALVAPMLMGQVRYTAGYTRSEETIRSNSAEFVDYLRLGSRALGDGWIPWLQEEGGSGQRLYPGTALLVLALSGIGWGWRRGKQGWVLLGLVSTLLAFGLSVGLNGEIGDIVPYEVLRDYVPGYRQLRSPFRLGLFVQLFLVLLAAFGVEMLITVLVRWWKGRFAQIALFIVLAVSLIEVLTPSARLYVVSPLTFDAAWIRWLWRVPDGAVVMVPFVEGSSASDYQATTIGMVQSFGHQHPLTNGYSGFFPDSHTLLKEVMASFPSVESVTLLRERGIRYVVADRAWERLPQLRAYPDFVELYEDDQKVIFQITAP